MLIFTITAEDYFYPRSPCGERLMLVESFSDNRHFYPRSPCGERRLTSFAGCWGLSISIHALLAESDCGSAAVIYS